MRVATGKRKTKPVHEDTAPPPNRWASADYSARSKAEAASARLCAVLRSKRTGAASVNASRRADTLGELLELRLVGDRSIVAP
jgi:hypothetical protein